MLPRSWGFGAIAAALVLEVAEAAFLWRYSRRRRAQVGLEAMVGLRATVVTPCRPLGQVRVHGELWHARCDQGADRGESVVVRAVEPDRLTLVAERAPR